MARPTGTELATRDVDRRPSGDAPVLSLGETWRRPAAVLAAVLVVGFVLATILRAWTGDAPEASVLATIRDVAPAWLLRLCERVDVLGSVMVVAALRVAIILVAAVYKRWRAALTFLVTLVLTDWVALRLLGVDRPAPAGVTTLTDRATFAFPSRPVVALSVTLAGCAYVLVPAGRPRRTAIGVALAISVLYAVSRVLLAADYPLDVAYAIALGFAAPAAAFAAFVPDDVFPVRYVRGEVTAHLDLGGERERTIASAMADQLGLTVLEVEPFGLEGSGGSSPLRMRVRELDGHLFGKIYTTSHLRADRWYRLGRTLLYGRLEDEFAFGSVRRLIEYEDYALRLLDDDGVAVARTYGIVELVPNREYMLVTEFFEGARTLNDAEVGDAVIDDGLALVRTLWDRGLAHRDLKPANLLVRDGHLQLIDVSGLEVRPTRWRRTIDLANMMLTLALRSDPDHVYERAVTVFDPEDIGEAFAADVGLAVPTELQKRLEGDPRPIAERFAQLAPDHPPISIQRWTTQRAALLLATGASAVVLVSMFVDSLLAGLR